MCARNPMKCLFNQESNNLISQIFKPREAFMMLSRELLDIIKKQSFEIFVDSVGVSVFISLVKKLDSEFNLYPCSISNAIFLSLCMRRMMSTPGQWSLLHLTPRATCTRCPSSQSVGDGCSYPMNPFHSLTAYSQSFSSSLLASSEESSHMCSTT